MKDASLVRANVGLKAALDEDDLLAHSFNRGVMRICSRILLRDAPAQGFNIEELRRRAHVDAVKVEYFTLELSNLESDKVTAGVKCICILQLILYSGQ